MHFSLGPVLSPRVDEAQTTAPLDRSRWQHGIVSAASAFDQPRSSYGAVQVLLGGGVGVVAGSAASGLPLYVQFIVGAVAALLAYWAVPTAWAAIGWWRAPTIPTGPGEEYARALETYAEQYAQWPARRE